jgi:hypothetical protein
VSEATQDKLKDDFQEFKNIMWGKPWHPILTYSKR